MTIENQISNPTQEATKPGWEERYAKYKASDFQVTVDLPVGHDLDDVEVERTLIKLDIIKEFAQDLALGMLKGSIKYLHDNRTPDEWAAFEEDEQNDVVNYRLLRKASEREHEQVELHRWRMGSGWKPSDEMHEIARRNGFRLEGDRLIQIAF